jgi:hypothetical protein
LDGRRRATGSEKGAGKNRRLSCGKCNCARRPRA